MERIKIKFIKDFSPYLKGEIASFLPKRAEQLIRHNIAVVFQPAEQADANRLKNVIKAPETKHIPGPEETRDQKPEQQKAPDQSAKNQKTKCSKCGREVKDLEGHIKRVH